MGPVFRIFCGLFVVTLIGAACGGGANIKPPPTAESKLVAIVIDPDTGSVVTIQGNPPRPYVKDQPLADTSKPAVTITTELKPVDLTTVQSLALSTQAPTGASCTIIIINGRPYCR